MLIHRRLKNEVSIIFDDSHNRSTLNLENNFKCMRGDSSVRLKKFQVTYSNLNTECLLDGRCTVTLFSESKTMVRQIAEDLYKKTEYFRITSVKEVRRA